MAGPGSDSAREGRGGVFERFFHSAVGGSVVLLASTGLALGLANSPWREAYAHLLHTPVGVAWTELSFTLSVHAWINDGLMALFFFVVGLEIKREVVVGHLSSIRLASLPAAAALGGMLVPAGLYTLFNRGGPAAHGWGIPMATDIAFALGVLALLGARVPLALKVFLSALAIADDLGAVLVIALFYTGRLRWLALILVALFLVIFRELLRRRVRSTMVLLLPVIGVWAAVFASGLHATVAGILAALMVPMRSAIDPQRFAEIVRGRLPELEREGVTRQSILTKEEQLDVVLELHQAAADLRPPGLMLERLLHPVQAYLVVPLFAFFNAGVGIDSRALHLATGPVSLGVIAGLVVGKPVGLMVFSWLAVRLGVSSLPAGVGWGALGAVSFLAGIGFTMALFIADLAFAGRPALDQAKVAILAASAFAGLAGYVLLRLTLPQRVEDEPG